MTHWVAGMDGVNHPFSNLDVSKASFHEQTHSSTLGEQFQASEGVQSICKHAPVEFKRRPL